MERDAASTSEATPPHAEDSPEMVSQPPTPEDERVSSSTDQQPDVAFDSPDEPRISSTSDQQSNVGVVSSSGPSAVSLETNEAERESSLTQSSSNAAREGESMHRPPDSTILRQILQAPPVFPRSGEEARSTIAGPLIQAGMVGTTVGSPTASKSIQMKLEADSPLRGSYEMAADVINQNVGGSSDSSNRQFVHDSSSIRKSAGENVALGSDSSGEEAKEERGSRSSTSETSKLGGDSSKTNAAVDKKSNSGTCSFRTLESKSELYPTKTGQPMLASGSGTMEELRLKNELSPSKTESDMSASGSASKDNVGLRKELSPSKSGVSDKETSDSAKNPEREQVFSPKRKSPTKFQHLSPKRSSFSSPNKQSDSQMSTLLEELDIRKSESDPTSSEAICGQEQKICVKAVKAGESRDSETNIEVQKPDSPTEQGKTGKKSEDDDSEMEE